MSLFKPTLAVALLSADLNYKLRHSHITFGKRHKKDRDIIKELTPKAWSFSIKETNQNFMLFVISIIMILSLEIIFVPSKRLTLILPILITGLLLALQIVDLEYLSLPANPKLILKIERVLLKHATIRNGILDANYSTKRVDVNFREVVDDGLHIKARDLLLDEGIQIIAVGECQFKTGSKKIHEKLYPIVNLQLPGNINRTYIGLSPCSYISLLSDINELIRLKDHSPTGHSQWLTYSLNENTGVWKRDWVKSEEDSHSGPNVLNNWWKHISDKT